MRHGRSAPFAIIGSVSGCPAHPPRRHKTLMSGSGNSGETLFPTSDRQTTPLGDRTRCARRRARCSRGTATSDTGGTVRRRMRDRSRRCDGRPHIWLPRGALLSAHRRTGPTGASIRHLGRAAAMSAVRMANWAGGPVESKRLHLAPRVVPVVLTIACRRCSGLSAMRASDFLLRKHLR